MEFHPLRASRLLRVRDDALGIRVVRVYEQCNYLVLGNELGKQLESLRDQLDGEEADAGEVAARPGETGNQAVRNRIGADPEDDRDCRGRFLRRVCRRDAAE